MFTPTEFNRPTDSAMKALILHDDFTLAAKAGAALQRAITCADAAVRWTVNSVPISALGQPTAAERILFEALDAHLIVFAGNCAQLLPRWVYQWLEQWADMRRVPDAGMAVMGNERQSSFGDVAPELFRFASKHQLTFIIDESAAPAKRAKLSIGDTLEEGFPVAVAQKAVPIRLVRSLPSAEKLRSALPGPPIISTSDNDWKRQVREGPSKDTS